MTRRGKAKADNDALQRIVVPVVIKDRDVDSRRGAVGAFGLPPDLQTSLHYLDAVQELLEWAPSGLVPKREAIGRLKHSVHSSRFER